MNNISFCPISGQSEKEERFNTITHFFGLVLSCVGFFYLLFLSFGKGNYETVISSFVYGSSLILLYGASTFYHKSTSLQKKKIFKIIDHACIYLLIAGSYTPFTLGPLKEHNGNLIMLIEWSIAFIGILVKIVAVNRFQVISLITYLVMGWLVVFSFDVLSQKMTPFSITLLVLGGLSYSLGTIFYVWERIPYNHGIWHLFVLLGSGFHYFSILELF